MVSNTETARTAVLVGCRKAKEDSRQLSWRLYKRNYFESKMTLAMLMGDPYIMSAKLGLVPPTERIDPYDKTNRGRPVADLREWGADVADSLPDHYERVILLGGRDYSPYVADALPDGVAVHDPFDEFGGNGAQMGWAIDAAEDLLEGASVSEVLREAGE